MPDATIKRLDEMETFYDGLVTRARAELGVTSWGMQVFDLPPHFEQYPNHNQRRTTSTKASSSRSSPPCSCCRPGNGQCSCFGTYSASRQRRSPS